MFKVSVIVPVYNVESYLVECLDSLVNQTLEDIEIICINDGSTDCSLKILYEYQAKYSRIRVIDKKNSGYGATINVGLKVAHGEYVGIVESDDFADKDMFKKLYELSEPRKPDIVKSNYFEHTNERDIVIDLVGEIQTDRIICPWGEGQQIFFTVPSIWSAIYKRDFLMKNDIWFNETPGASFQDVSFQFKTLACANRMLVTKEAFLHYRLDNMTSSSHSREKAFCIFEEFDEIWRFIDSRDDLNNVIKFLAPPLEYRRFMYEYGRTLNKTKLKFMKEIIARFQILSKRNIIKKDFWKDDMAWYHVSKMIKEPIKVLYRTYINSQNQRICMASLNNLLDRFRFVYIYGAGTVSNEILSYLKSSGFQVKGILVTESEKNPHLFLSLPVQGIDKSDIDKDNSLILIATAEKNQWEIINLLEERGFSNILSIDTKMRQCFQEQFSAR